MTESPKSPPPTTHRLVLSDECKEHLAKCLNACRTPAGKIDPASLVAHDDTDRGARFTLATGLDLLLEDLLSEADFYEEVEAALEYLVAELTKCLKATRACHPRRRAAPKPD